MSCNISTFEKMTQAGAQAYYACKYYEGIDSTNKIRNIIATAQAVTQVYFADKQYEVSKQAQTRLDNISTIELARSGKLFGQFEKQIDEEDAQLADAADIEVPEPDWNSIRLRVTASVTKEFTAAFKKIAECYPANCVEAKCDAENRLRGEMAKAIASNVEQTYQRERALWELRQKTNRAHLLEVLKFGRGALGESRVLLSGAQSSIQQSASINPYSGWIQAVNGIAQTAQGITTQDALAFRGMGANVGNAWSLGQNANISTTELTNGINSRVDDFFANRAQGLYQMTEATLGNSGAGDIGGETPLVSMGGDNVANQYTLTPQKF
jgi:hypothetical protein